MRVVLDPNVLVSALISRGGPPRKLIEFWVEGHFELIASPKLVGELREVLNRPKFGRWASSETISEYLSGIEDASIEVEDPPDPELRSSDPDDDYLLALAEAAGAGLLGLWRPGLNWPQGLLAAYPHAKAAMRPDCRSLDDISPDSRMRSPSP